VSHTHPLPASSVLEISAFYNLPFYLSVRRFPQHLSPRGLVLFSWCRSRLPQTLLFQISRTLPGTQSVLNKHLLNK
jgi:hypothetical protein